MRPRSAGGIVLITNDAWSEKEKDVKNLTREREHLNAVRAQA